MAADLTDEQFQAWVFQELERVEAKLYQAAQAQSDFVAEAARYLVDSGGKRFRPALTIAVGGLGSADGDALEDSAVVVELTHVASLYHDDVMDEAALRRGRPSANARWGNSVAIMVGDFLLAQASVIGASLGLDFVAYQGRTLARLVQGQIGELRGPGEAEAVDHHLSVVTDKTGSLIAASARYGAMAAGLAPAETDTLTEFGEQVGVVFQLADDLIDIVSDSAGKPGGLDLREGVLTLAPLLVLRDARAQDQRLVELLSAPVAEADLAETLALLRVHPAVDEVRAIIETRVEAAKQLLVDLPDSAAKRALLLLADQAVHRTA